MEALLLVVTMVREAAMVAEVVRVAESRAVRPGR